MPTAFEVLHFLGLGTGDTYPDFEVTGVAPLHRAKPHEMTFRKGDSDLKTESQLVLSKEDFVKAAWRFFPPKTPSSVYGRIHPTAIIGKEGFGYVGELHMPHYGGVKIGADVSIGAYTVIDRGVFDDTVIGDGTKIDNLVHIAHNVQIGKRCLIVAGSVLGGSCVIGDDCFIGIGALIKDHIRIGHNVTVGMGAVVVKDVEDGETVFGNPAKNKAERLNAAFGVRGFG